MAGVGGALDNTRGVVYGVGFVKNRRRYHENRPQRY